MQWNDLVPVAEAAGKAILGFYGKQFTVTNKTDNSPLTDADVAAHTIIVEALGSTPFPVLSEEGVIPFIQREHWDTYWLVDPLDGTKEFIHQNGEFTVNIALIKDGEPILGLVYAPVLGTLYGAEEGQAFRFVEGKRIPLHISQKNSPLRILTSRFHQSQETNAFIARLPSSITLEAGSSLKFCRLAEGRADIYPRFAPTMEWDTAAGQAILEAAGGLVCDTHGNRLRYNKQDLTNPSFIAYGDPTLKSLGKEI